MREIPIRRAAITDLPHIDRLADAVLAEHGFPCDSAVARLDASYFVPRGAVALGAARFWVAHEGDAVVGSAAVVLAAEAVCTFKTFYVHAAYRRRKIGSRLHAAAEAFAREARYAVIELYVSRRFRHAINIYERNGYTAVRELDNLWQDVVYRKTL